MRTIPIRLQIEPLKWKKHEYEKYPGYEGEYFNLLFDKLLEDNVMVFIVIIPDFINVYKTNYERDIFLNDIKSLFKTYPNVRVLNYNSPDKFDLSNTRYFRDGKFGKANSHLSYYGAEIFNKMLCNDIEKLITIK